MNHAFTHSGHQFSLLVPKKLQKKVKLVPVGTGTSVKIDPNMVKYLLMQDKLQK